MALRLGEDSLKRYERFSLYNSPYPAHDRGCAIDLYPDSSETVARSPVAGTVLETKTVRAPPKPGSPSDDHLIVLECVAPASVAGLSARVLHVDPTVEPGDEVDLGEPLGTLVHTGFFDPWVENHLHVGFREPAQNVHRASGSIPIELGFEVTPLDWDGTGAVLETGETYAVLDSPVSSNRGKFVGLGADGGGVLDGGLPHYDNGGLLEGPDGPVTLDGDHLGVADGRTVTWDDVTVTANGDPIAGLSLSCTRATTLGVKLVCPHRSFERGTDVRIRIVPSADL